MKKITELALLPCLTLLIGFVVSPFLKGLWDYAENAVLPELSPQARLSLVATLAIICLAESAWIFILIFGKSAERWKRNYEFVSDQGYYRHKKTGALICGNCFLEGKESPLAKLRGGYAACQNNDCQKAY